MYSLPYFRENDPSRVIEFVKAHPFAFLAGCDETRQPVATQVPLFIEEREGRLFLSGHMMRNTDHHKAFEQNPCVLAVFTGPHAYVSASWYTEPKTASTWNYMSVHAKGTMKFLDESALLGILKHTTDHFENNPHSPSNYDQLPADYVQRLAKAIVAFEVEVDTIGNVFKLSQNRDEESYHRIIEKLDSMDGNGKALADEMKARKDQLFK
ncbi:MAG: FMN-binding negative transcriptional regulator [Chitinophagaceae bacterium]|jgi:transcriptional regulator|nr:FMN-binding negative transcriptional regulator [Chitinophagaceae bacterium]